MRRVEKQKRGRHAWQRAEKSVPTTLFDVEDGVDGGEKDDDDEEEEEVVGSSDEERDSTDPSASGENGITESGNTGDSDRIASSIQDIRPDNHVYLLISIT